MKKFVLTERLVVKKVLMLALAIMMIASYAMAGDHMGVYTDQAGTTCEFSATAVGPVDLYVVHKTTGATGSQFKVVNTMDWTFNASVLNGYLAIGDAFTDLSLAYGSCLVGPDLPVVQLSGFSFPLPGKTCGFLDIVAADVPQKLLTVDCTFAEVEITGGRLSFNNDGTCPCGPVTATEESTWGKVKSLYR